MRNWFQNIDKFLLPWFVIGIVLRLVLMPIAAHNDTMDSHWRSHTLASGDVLYPGKYQYLNHAVDAVWMIIVSPLLPDGIDTFKPPEHRKDVMFASSVDFNEFVKQPHIQWVLFLSKVPYLIADLVAVWLLLKLFNDRRQKRWAFALWMLSPGLLYAVYIFGRYETYSLLVIVGSLILAKRGRIFWAGLLLGVAVAFRTTPLFLVPVYALALTKDRWKQIVIFALGILPNALIVFFMEVVLHLKPAPYALSLVVSSGPIGMLTNRIFEPVPIMPYFFGYTLLLLWLDRQPAAWKMVVQGSLVAYLLMFVFCWHSAHYIAWLTPFLVILVAWNPRDLRYYVLFIGTWAAYWMFATDAGVFTRYLFSPLFGRALIPQQTQDTLMPHLDFLMLNLEQVTALLRSFLAAAAAWLIYLASLGADRADREV